MNKATLLLATALLGAATPGQARPNASITKPNIIVILADDLGYGDVGAFGEQRFKTPNIDALAQCGTRFTDAYAGSPVCAPSRASLLTGKDTGHGQVRGNVVGSDLPLAADTPTVSSVLKSAGYTNGAFGKWGLGGPDSAGAPWRHGFDRFYGYLDHVSAHNYYPANLWNNNERVALGNKSLPPHSMLMSKAAEAREYRNYIGVDYAPYRIVSEAERFIDANRGAPFFLYFAPTMPHSALQVPEDLSKRFAGRWAETPYPGPTYVPNPAPRATRAAMIAELDAEVGRIVKQVRRSGLADRTLIIFTSDNGPTEEGGQDLDFFASAGGLRGAKRDLYEGGIRVPMIACWPGHIPARKTDATPIASWDFLPTFAELAGVAQMPPGMNGTSIVPVLTGRRTLPERSFYWEFHEKGKKAQAVRIGRWKGIRFQPKGFDQSQPIELYDLNRDRAEKSDVASQHPEIVARIAAVMNGRVRSSLKGFNFDIVEQE